MRNLKAMMVLAGILALFVIPAVADQSLADSVAVISDHSGNAKIYTDSQWKDAEINMPLFEGDYVKTGTDSAIEITFDDATIVKLGDNTDLKLTELKRKENIATTVFDLLKGKFLAIVDHLTNTDSKFEVHTKMAIAAVKGTELAIEAGEDNTKLGVYTGAVEFKNNNGVSVKASAVVVIKGTESSIDKNGGKPTDPAAIREMLKFESDFGKLRETVRTVRDLKLQGHDKVIQWMLKKKAEKQGSGLDKSSPRLFEAGINNNAEVKKRVQEALKLRLRNEFSKERSYAYKDLRYINEEMKADLHLGKTLTDVHGNRVRIEEYIYRPKADQVDLLSLTMRDKNRLDYLRAENIFNKDLPQNPTWKEWHSMWQTEWYVNAPTYYLQEQRVKMSNINDWVFMGTTYQGYWSGTILGGLVNDYKLLKDQEILAFGSGEITGDMTVNNFTALAASSLALGPNAGFVREQRIYGYEPTAGATFLTSNPNDGSQTAFRGPLDKTYANAAAYSAAQSAIANSNTKYSPYAALMPLSSASVSQYNETNAMPSGTDKLSLLHTRYYNDGSWLSLNIYLIDDYGLLKTVLKPDSSLIQAVSWLNDLVFNTNVELSVRSSVFVDKNMGIDVVSKMLWYIMLNPKNSANPSPGSAGAISTL